MDLISEAVGTLRTGRAFASRLGMSGAWGERYGAFDGMGFHALLSGDCWVLTDGAAPLRAYQGDVVLVPHGAAHALSARPGPFAAVPLSPMTGGAGAVGPFDAEVLCACYRLGHGRVHPFLRGLPEVLVLRAGPRVRALLELLAGDLDLLSPGAEATRAAFADLLLVELLRLARADAPAPADPGVEAALRAIAEDPRAGWTVRRLGEVAGMSRTSFARRFAEVMGTPPMAYVTAWRLSRGARLLRETDAPLAAIAREVGYATEFAFAGAFRREYGVAPGRFRRDEIVRAVPVDDLVSTGSSAR